MKDPIRILHVLDTLGKGGLENGLVNLINRLDPERFEHVVLTMRGLGENAEKLPKDRVRILCLGKKATDSAFQVPALARSIRHIQPDIVHSRNWAAIEAVVAAWWSRSGSIVHSEHGVEAETSIEEPWRRKRLRRIAYSLADRVLTVSHQLKELHAKRTGFPASKISVFHNGVDSRRYYQDLEARTAVRRELGVRPGEFCVVCVGNLSLVKDHLTLLRAVEKLTGSWRLFIVGRGPELPNLKAFVDSRPGWQDRVSFLGLSDRVGQLLNAMDAYVLPSLSEGISNSLLEAMATGLPVVATAAGGNPEVVVDGVSGMLFPVGDFSRLTDHLAALGASEEMRRQFGSRALQRVRESFSIDSMVRNYAELYESLNPMLENTVEATA